jgi:hypothetical protein
MRLPEHVEQLLVGDFCAAAELVSARSPKASKSTRRPAMFCRVASSTGSGGGLFCGGGAGGGCAGGGLSLSCRVLLALAATFLTCRMAAE